MTLNLAFKSDPFNELNGYEAKTTFWSDFSIAEQFGRKGIEDTYHRAIKEWGDNYVFVTELSLVLNHKMWLFHEKIPSLSKLYQDLWLKVDSYAFSHFESNGEAISYYVQVTD